MAAQARGIQSGIFSEPVLAWATIGIPPANYRPFGMTRHTRSASDKPFGMTILRSTIRALDRIASALGRAPARAPHLAFGSRGEDEAFFYLRKLGFTVVARDYRSPRRRGDIDLIAWEKDTLCFVEVKTRSRQDFMPAEAAVDAEKKETLRALAREYLRQRAHANRNEPSFRFDVISIYLESNRPADITLFRDAFFMS